MILWFRRTQGLDTETMREIADAAGVEWDYQSIVYQAQGIGYADGDESDETAIQDAAEELLGYRPRPYDPPERPDVKTSNRPDASQPPYSDTSRQPKK